MVKVVQAVEVYSKALLGFVYVWIFLYFRVHPGRLGLQLRGRALALQAGGFDPQTLPRKRLMNAYFNFQVLILLLSKFFTQHFHWSSSVFFLTFSLNSELFNHEFANAQFTHFTAGSHLLSTCSLWTCGLGKEPCSHYLTLWNVWDFFCSLSWVQCESFYE